jgi:hypothetical protein
MNLYGRAGRNAFRCGCGTRVQVVAAPVTTRICTFGECRTLATTKEPLRFCPEHEEQASTLLAHTAGAVKVRELEIGLTQGETTWARRYGSRIRRGPQDTAHAPTVYFARKEHLIKIGTTTNLYVRMATLYTQALATEPGGIVRERQLHRRFGHLLAPGRGREWFHPEPELMEYINELRTASGIPPVGSPAPPIGQYVEIDTYLAETTEQRPVRTLTQNGEPLAGRMVMEKLARSHPRSQVHAAVTGTWQTRRLAVAACTPSREIGAGSGGLVTASTVPSRDLCNRLPCLARWDTLTD